MLSNRPITSCADCPLGAASASRRCEFLCSTRLAGALICAQGEIPSTIYFVKTGLISLSATDSDRTLAALALRGPSSLLCTEAIQRRPSPHTLHVLSRARLCAIPGELLKRWIGPEHGPARALLDLLLDESHLQHLEQELHQGDCTRRVARFALIFEHFLEEQPDAVPKQMLAQMLGMRPETLSRCLTRLDRCGAIDASQGLRVRQPRLLSSMIGPAAG